MLNTGGIISLKQYYKNNIKNYSDLAEMAPLDRDLHIFEEFWANNNMSEDDWKFAESLGIDRSLFSEPRLIELNYGEARVFSDEDGINITPVGWNMIIEFNPDDWTEEMAIAFLNKNMKKFKDMENINVHEIKL